MTVPKAAEAVKPSAAELTPHAAAAKAARLAREAAALRDNLRRRKQQGRDVKPAADETPG